MSQVKAIAKITFSVLHLLVLILLIPFFAILFAIRWLVFRLILRYHLIKTGVPPMEADRIMH